MTRHGGVTALAIARPVTVVMIMVAALVFGALAWRDIPREFLPSGLAPPFLFVQVPTLRAAPEDVERRLAVPVEDALSTVRSLRRLGTRIEANSASFILEFDDQTDMDDVYEQVRERMERVEPALGDDVGQWFIWKYNPADDPVIWMGVTLPDTVDDPGAVIEQLVVPRLERLPGVSRVDVNGAARRAVTIEIDDQLAESSGTNMPQLIGVLSRDNFALSAGRVPDGGTQVPVRAIARIDSLEQLRALPVGGGRVLGDIARVFIEDRAERAIYRVNRRPGVFVEVYRESAANTVEVADAVRAVIADLHRDPRLGGVEFHSFFDQGKMIDDSIANLMQSAMWGGVLAVIVLIVFLRHLRMTLIIATSIPICMLLTVAIMFFDGWTLNLLSLMGLMLSVGMVVDNAIVVVESIQRRRIEGLPAREAVIRGAADVALAIAVSTLTTVVVFAPIILMGGNVMISFYLSQIGFPLCVGLLVSLVVALVAVPMVAARALDASAPAEPRWAVALDNAYARGLAWVLRRRTDAVLISLAALASIAFPAQTVISTDQSEPNINDFRVFTEMPASAGWEEKRALLMQVEARLWAARQELGVRDLYTRMGDGRWGRPQVRVFLVDGAERTLDRDATIARALELLGEPPPGVRYSIGWDGAGGPTRATTVSVVGADSRRLAELAEEVARRLRLLPGVTSVRSESNEGGEPEARLFLDRERMFRAGLNAATVGGVVDFAVRGRQIGEMSLEGGDLPVYVRGNVAGQGALANLAGVDLPGPVADVTLASMAETHMARGFEQIDREDGRTVVTLTIQTSEDDLAGLSQQIDRVVADFAWPRGYGLEKGDRFESFAMDARDRNFALLLAVVFVFLLMGILFESFVLPLSIVLSIPFAFVGAWWGLWIAGESLDLMAGAGLVILIGVVVNNAIVLVDCIGELRRSGMPRTQAVVEAGRLRLRPILMTALTTICGLVPMATGSASLVGLSYAPLGVALMGGMVASTLLTLGVVPLFYTLFDDVRQRVPSALDPRASLRALWAAVRPSSDRGEA